MKTASFLFLILLPFVAAFGETDYAKERMKMAKEQLAGSDIEDRRVLDIMGLVERHRFVPEPDRPQSYEDVAISISKDRVMASPHSVAFAVQLLKLNGGEKVLEVGTGSGYQTAVLAELSKEVYSIEPVEDLAKGAEKRLDELEYRNIKIKTGNPDFGWRDYAPFDRVIVNLPCSYIPQKLIDQLKVNGMLLINVGEGNSNKLLLIQKQAGEKLKKDEIKVTLVGDLVKEKPTVAMKAQSIKEPETSSSEEKKWKTVGNSRWKKRQR